MGSMSLPPGFRFHPTDDELVSYYLKRKVDGLTIELEVIPVIDLYKFDPWQLPEKSFLPKRDMEWFFFCPRDKKYPNGSRTNRATTSGYWKATGKDRKVFCEFSVQGLRKTLVFYRGRAPGGERTDWVMHEYRLCEDLSQATPNFLGAFALCRVVKRNEHGFRVGDSPKEESKGKRSFPYVASEFSPRKNFDKGMNNVQAHSSQAGCVFEISNDPPPLTSMETEIQPFILETDQVSQYFCDSPKDYCLAQSFLSEPIHQIQFPNSLETCHSNSISPVSSYQSLNEAINYSVDELDTRGSFSFSPSPLDHTNMYCNEEDMGFQGFGWGMSAYMDTPFNGFEASNTMLYPSLCRQASDPEEPSLWLQEENMTAVM